MAGRGVPTTREDFVGSLRTHVEQVAWLLAFQYENELQQKSGTNGANNGYNTGLQKALQDLSHFHAQVARLRLEADHEFDDLGVVPSDFEDLGTVPDEVNSDSQNGSLSVNQIEIDQKYPEKPSPEQDSHRRDSWERLSPSDDDKYSQASSYQNMNEFESEIGEVSTKQVSFAHKITSDSQFSHQMSGPDVQTRTSSQPSLQRRTRTQTTNLSQIASFTILPIWVESDSPTLLRSESFLMGRISVSSTQTFMITESELILSSMTPSPVTILPGSRLRSLWDILTLLLIMYDCIATPLELLHLPESVFQEVMGWVIRIFWTMDIGVNFLTGFIRRDGLTEVRFAAIGKRYAKTWLFADVCLVLSDWSEVLIEALNSEASIARMAKTSRVIRTFRTLRFVKMQKAMNFLKLRVESELLGLVLDILRALIVMFGWVHVATCVWCGLGVWTSEWGEQTWLYAAGLENIAAGDLYMEGFMWALGQFSGGVDFVRPQNSDERIFSVAALIAGFILDSAFISGVTSEATKLMLIAGGPSKQLAHLRRYLSQHSVSRVLTVRIQRNARYHMMILDKRIGEEQVEALKFISEPLMQELFLEIHGPHLTIHPLFSSYLKLCPAGIRQICFSAVCTKWISVGDTLFHRLEAPVVPKVFFLLQGTLRYQQRRDENLEVEPGEWAAEAVLWTMWTHCGTLSGMTPCQVMELDAKSFQTIVKTSENAVNVEEYAMNFVEELNGVPSSDLTDIGNAKTALGSVRPSGRQLSHDA